MRRCINNKFGYCKREPKIVEQTEIVADEKNDITITVSKCALDPKTCGQYYLLSDIVKTDNVPKSSFRTTTKTPEKEIEETTVKKGKGKKIKASVSPQQGSLFQ